MMLSRLDKLTQAWVIYAVPLYQFQKMKESTTKQTSSRLHKTVIDYDYDYFQFMKDDYDYIFTFAGGITITIMIIYFFKF